MNKYFNNFISMFSGRSKSKRSNLILKENEIDSEEKLFERSLANVKARLTSKGILPESDEAIAYLSRDKVVYPPLEKKKKTVEKPARKKRVLTYKLHTISGLILFEGKDFRKFMFTTNLVLPFNYKSAYYFAKEYQGEKPFHKNFVISFTEVI